MERVPAADTPNLIVYLNHPSWWDPLTGFVLARRFFPGRYFYAPMDAEALERYGIFRRLGLFPVRMHSLHGAAQFLRTGAAVLDRGHILAVTSQGQFTDVRTRPVHLQGGLAALLQRRAAQGSATTVLPLALEYTFWNQRLPEVLVNCGTPWVVREDTLHSEEQSSANARQRTIHATLERAMTDAQDELAALSLLRDPQHFTPLLAGTHGSAGVYGWIERIRAMMGGHPQRGDHQTGPAAANAGAAARKG